MLRSRHCKLHASSSQLLHIIPRLLAQVSVCVAVAGAPITLDSCATSVPSPDCKVQPWAGAPRPVNDSERLQAVDEVARGIKSQSTDFLPDRYIELCRRIFDVSLHDALHVCLSAPGRPSHLYLKLQQTRCHMLQQP